MSDNGEKVDECFPKLKMTSSNVLFCPQTKDIHIKESSIRQFRRFS